MAQTLDQVLEGKALPGVPALQAALGRLFDAPSGAALVDAQAKLSHRVFRLSFSSSSARQAVVVKLLDAPAAARCEAVASVWLPALGLEELPATLLATASGDEAHVWHVYESVPGSLLDEARADMPRVSAAVARIAALHIRSARHALLKEARQVGGDRGAAFFSLNVRGAAQRIDELITGCCTTARRRTLLERLRDRIDLVLQANDRYGDLLDRWGGPDVLVHGDLWPQNVVVDRGDEQYVARIIDWDRCGVGPILYDLSAFLSRFPADERRGVLRLYEQQIARTELRVPPPRALNEMAALAESARLASCIIYPAAAAATATGSVDWAWDELIEVDEWFDLAQPLLPELVKDKVSA